MMEGTCRRIEPVDARAQDGPASMPGLGAKTCQRILLRSASPDAVVNGRRGARSEWPGRCAQTKSFPIISS
jgi:hypothetical protein